MLVLRCTEGLFDKKPGPVSEKQDDLRSVYGDWHANLVRMGPTPVVLAMNDVTLLSVVLPGNHFREILTLFKA